MRFLRRPASVRCPGAPHRAAVAFFFALFLAASCASFDADARAQSLPTDVKPSNGSTVSQQSALSTPSGPSSASASAPLAEDDPEPRPAVAALPRHVFSENEAEPEEGRTGDTPTLVFGVPASDEPGFREELLLPTYEALRRAFPDHRIEWREMSKFDLILAVVKREVDLYVVSSGFFAYLTHGAGSSWLATRKIPQASDPEHAVGGLVVARADDDRYATIADLRTARVAAASSQSFPSWTAVLGEIANVTSYPEHFLGKPRFTGDSGLSVVERVLRKETDVGFLRTCEYESLVARGLVHPQALKVVGERTSEALACRTSTDLYPDLVLAARPDLSDSVRRRAAAAVFSIPESASGYAWTVANDFRSVRRLVARFGSAPSEHAEPSAALDRYKYALVISVLLLGGAILYSVSVSGVVARRTKELVAVIDEKTTLEQTARVSRERLSQLERAGIVSELSSMIAHELRQPVAGLVNYADGLALYLSGKQDPVVEEATREIARQAERVSSIVERVRAYAKGQSDVRQSSDLCVVAKRAFTTFRSGADLTGVRVSGEFLPEAPVSGDPLELELLVVNCLKNALHAAKSSPDGHGEIRIRVSDDASGEKWCLEVEDNGPRIDDAKFAELSHPVTSEKFEGLGLGLSISRVIAERHAARLLFRRAGERGLVVTLLIAKRPVEAEDASHGTGGMNGMDGTLAAPKAAPASHSGADPSRNVLSDE